jgi:RNA polymerase sigma factor (sigma-70 family)
MSAASDDLWHCIDAVPHMGNHRLFEENLDAIEHAIALVCRKVRLQGADAEDFASSTRVALLAGDGAILRKYEGRSSLAGYLAVVIQRLFYTQKRAEGRWSPSAEATRRGAAAVLFERLLVHEGRPMSEALTDTKTQHPDADVRDLESSAAAFPERAQRARLVPIVEGDEERISSGMRADDRVRSTELERTCTRASQSVRAALDAMTPQDRVILRLRFGKGAAVSDIARIIGLPQRPLYRRIEALLADLRAALERSGVAAGDVADVVEAAAGDLLDFGLDEGQTAGMPPSSQLENP